MGTKTLTECRSTFKNFFAKNSHQIVDSSPLVPQNNPTKIDSLSSTGFFPPQLLILLSLNKINSPHKK